MKRLGSFATGSRSEEAVHRLVMAASSVRLVGRRDRSARALARALRTGALSRFHRDERAWITRIEERRERVASQGASHYLGPSAPVAGTEADPAAAYLATWSRAWSVPTLWGDLLLALIRQLAPRSCLELGTGYGISALYVGAALELNGGGTLTTLDREPRLIPIAEQGISELGLDGMIDVRGGAIEQTLAGALADTGPIDFALIDAEHTERATVDHFERLVPGLAAGAVVLIDDIHLSEGMTRAWMRIAAHNRVSIALDLRRLGIAMVRDAHPRLIR